MIRSIVVTSRFDVPFATEDVFSGGITLDERSFPTPDLARSHLDIEEKLSLVPGVRAVALATRYPRAGTGSIVDIEGRTFDGPEAYPRAQLIVGSTRYFDVLRVKPLLGRVFDRTDVEGGQPVVVVDETFARVHLPEGPIGRRIRFGQQRTEGLSFESSPTNAVYTNTWLTVVGVVPALVETGRTDRASTLVFRPLAQAPTRFLSVFAVATGDPLAVTSGVRTTLAEIGDGTALTNPTTLAAAIWQEGWSVRVFGGLFMAFGFAALVLASAGLYGVMAFGVQQRTQEIGVRMAMGAGRGRVLRMILWQGVWRVGLAVAVGLVPGWQLGKALGEIIPGVSPSDPLVLSITASTLLASGAVASLVPALRAASVDPIVALRGE
jgi:putative ABC transport system permease protein